MLRVHPSWSRPSKYSDTPAWSRDLTCQAVTNPLASNASSRPTELTVEKMVGALMESYDNFHKGHTPAVDIK
jgi:hypothetical protein